MIQKRLFVGLILVLAFAGLADSVYLAQSAATGEPLLCNIENFSNCNVVAQSPYSRMFFGIPTADLGVVFYGVLFIVAALELVLSERLLRRVIQALAVIGVLASIAFTFIQMFLIGAFCIYCLASAVIAGLIFLCAFFIESVRPEKKEEPPESTAPSARPFSMPPAL